MRDASMQRCLDTILAVLVLYRRELAATEAVSSIAAGLRECGCSLDLFVYDNSPEAMVPGAAAGGCFRLGYVHDPTNPGVSRAFNEGARRAREKGKSWLLLLDQDTDFPAGALAAYCRALAEHADLRLIVPRLLASGRLCSPCGYWAGIGYLLKEVQAGELPLAGKGVLNSGMLVRLDAFTACGGYDERVRLDFADFVFLNRFRSRYDRAWLLDLDCGHGFSDSEEQDEAAALARFAGFCRDARAAATTPLLRVTHRFLALRRCLRLTCRYRTPGFLRQLLGGGRWA
jgi:rhamnosyltransferase